MLPLKLLDESLMCPGHLLDGLVALFLHPFNLLLILLLSLLDGLFGLDYAQARLLQLRLLDLLESALRLLLADDELLLVSLLLPLDELLEVLVLRLQSPHLGLQLGYLALEVQGKLGQLFVEGLIVFLLQFGDLVPVLLLELLQLKVGIFLRCAMLVLEVLCQI